MTLRTAPLAAAIPLLLLGAGRAHPQALPTYLHRLPEEAEVRLELASGQLLRGRIARQDSATLTLRRINRDRGHPPFLEHRIVALDSLVRGWAHGGNHWKLGTALGAGVGVLGMLVVGQITLSTQDGSSCNAGCWLGALGLGAAVGGGIGYLVGHAIPVWTEVGIAPP